MERILCVGYLQQFLDERIFLLRQAGFKVASATCLDEAVTAMKGQAYAVAILGHGIPTLDRNLIAAALRERSPGMKQIFLYEESIERAEIADAILNVHGDPKDLIQAVVYLAEKRGPAGLRQSMNG